MLYVIYGDNIERRKKAKNEISIKETSGVKEIIEADIVINTETENKEQKISESINTQNLWGDSLIINLDKILEDKEIKDIIYENLEAIKNSDNKFIIEETKINAAVLTKISKYATKVYDCTPGELVNNKGNNRVPEKSPFKLCDYIAAKDKKNAWIELMKLYQTDIESEPLHGAIWWKIKTILSGYESGSLNIKQKYNKQELESLSYTFVMISLRAHNGECDFRNEMERWVLNIQ